MKLHITIQKGSETAAGVIAALEAKGWEIETREIGLAEFSDVPRGVYYASSGTKEDRSIEEQDTLRLLDDMKMMGLTPERVTSPAIPLLVPSDEHIGLAIL